MCCCSLTDPTGSVVKPERGNISQLSLVLSSYFWNADCIQGIFSEVRVSTFHECQTEC